VYVGIRGAAEEKARFGGSSTTIEKLRKLFDSSLRKEMEDLGFREVTFAKLDGAEKFELDVPTDHELAQQELAKFGLSERLRVQ